MKTFKYKFGDQSNTIRIGNLLDDLWQVHEYFHKWQRQRYKDGLPYANYNAMSAHLTNLKRTTHSHWKALPSQAIQEELRRIDKAYIRFFKKLGGRPKIKKRHKFKSFTLKQAGWSLKDHRLTLNFRKWNTGKWRHDKVAYTFHKHREFEGTIRRITIKRDACGDYWLYILTDFVETKPLPTTGKSVGADFGMKEAYLTLSTGEKKQHPQPLSALQQTIMECRSDSYFGESNTIYLIPTAILETISWKAGRNDAYLRERQNSTRVPKSGTSDKKLTWINES